MGSACCVAARERTIPSKAQSEPSRRNITCSPSWSFRLDNRRRGAGEIEEPSYQFSHGISKDASMEMKGALGSGRVNLSDQGSPFENYGTPTSQKSPVHEELGRNLSTPFSDISTASNYSREVRNVAESPDNPEASTLKLSFPMASSLSPPIMGTKHTHLRPPNSTPSRLARRSPGHRLLRQVSDSRILGLKSPSNISLSEGRSSFVLSAHGNDLMVGSHGGSSVGWSLRTFSELVASSQRERWSFDSDNFGSAHGKTSGSSSRFSYSPTVDLQTCSSCSKRLTERSSWFANEISAIAVLVCGHVYHAECLEKMTPEADRYDPPCPICVVDEKQGSKLAKKAMKAEAKFKLRSLKMLKNRVVDSYVDGGCDDFHPRREGKAPKLEPSSSTRRSLPKMKRHFSIGSKWGRCPLDDDSPRKKGFLSRYWKD